MDLAQMDAEEEAEFREAVGAGESGMNRIIRLSYDVVGLITFLTIGDDEVRAWELPKGTPASRAAGRIHTDFEQGFIRAEVVEFDDLVACGGFAEARKRGVLPPGGEGLRRAGRGRHARAVQSIVEIEKSPYSPFL